MQGAISCAVINLLNEVNYIIIPSIFFPSTQSFAQLYWSHRWEISQLLYHSNHRISLLLTLGSHIHVIHKDILLLLWYNYNLKHCCQLTCMRYIRSSKWESSGKHSIRSVTCIMRPSPRAVHFIKKCFNKCVILQELLTNALIWNLILYQHIYWI